LEELLGYLDEWKITVKARPGFEDDEKQHMILSTATENGIRITGMHMSPAVYIMIILQ